MHERQYDVAGKLQKAKRRFDTLTMHLAHYENLKAHKAIYQKYRQLDPKKRDAFYAKHSEEIEKYKEAKKYLDAVMNGKTPIPVKDWRKELLDKTAEKNALYDKFYKLRGDVRNVEVLRRGAERIMSEDAPEQTRKRDLSR